MKPIFRYILLTLASVLGAFWSDTPIVDEQLPRAPK